jgi:thiol-disulfide isomerase/thioredoxin
MTGLTATVAMHLALLTTSADVYQEAYSKAEKDGKPLLVLVGAEWCPGCRIMKDDVIPKLETDGGLEDVVFTTVNTDEKPTLSRRLLRGTAIPQLVMYARTSKGWRRTELTGVQDPGRIRQFIRRGIVEASEAPADKRPSAPAPVDRPTAPDASNIH